MLGFDALKLDGDLFAGDDVGSFEVLDKFEQMEDSSDRGRYHQNSRFQSYDRYGTYCPHGDPRMMDSCQHKTREHAMPRLGHYNSVGQASWQGSQMKMPKSSSACRYFSLEVDSTENPQRSLHCLDTMPRNVVRTMVVILTVEETLKYR